MTIHKVPYTLDLSHLGVIEGVSYVNTNPTVPSDNYPYPHNLKDRVLCRYFGGIPYALPPVGPYRFKKPRPLPACYRYGTHANPGRFNGKTGLCPQPTKDPEEWEEDCLQLNIWMPAGKPPSGGMMEAFLLVSDCSIAGLWLYLVVLANNMHRLARICIHP